MQTTYTMRLNISEVLLEVLFISLLILLLIFWSFVMLFFHYINCWYLYFMPNFTLILIHWCTPCDATILI